VADVAVTGEADPEWGQRVVAVVVPRDWSLPPTLEQLRAHGRALLPAHALPRAVEVVRALPRTRSGKVPRSGLRGD
jgi:acyl-coenzyme A synthetase/AMP-(fatty) acid ligase